ncbi:hypothetical protein Tco_1033608, partial [Tanacetum coccineum]
IAPHHNPFFNPTLLNWNWDDVIVVPSDDDEGHAEEDIYTSVNTQVHVKNRKRVFALIDERGSDDEPLQEDLKRIQYNTIYTYMEFQYDEMVVELVATVVKNIDDQILSAFMELDPVSIRQMLILTLRSLVEDKTHRKMLIDTIGGVIRGGLKQPKGVNTCEIWLRDLTGEEIKFVSNHTLRKVAIRIAKVIQEYGTIYLTRVMLVHTKSGNLLVDTELTGVEIDPAFHKSQALMKMSI